MKKTEKIQIRKKVDAALSAILKRLNLTKASKKTSKAISKASKALRKDLEAMVKKVKKQAKKKPAKKVTSRTGSSKVRRKN